MSRVWVVFVRGPQQCSRNSRVVRPATHVLHHTKAKSQPTRGADILLLPLVNVMTRYGLGSREQCSGSGRRDWDGRLKCQNNVSGRWPSKVEHSILQRRAYRTRIPDGTSPLGRCPQANVVQTRKPSAAGSSLSWLMVSCGLKDNHCPLS